MDLQHQTLDKRIKRQEHQLLMSCQKLMLIEQSGKEAMLELYLVMLV